MKSQCQDIRNEGGVIIHVLLRFFKKILACIYTTVYSTFIIKGYHNANPNTITPPLFGTLLGLNLLVYINLSASQCITVRKIYSQNSPFKFQFINISQLNNDSAT